MRWSCRSREPPVRVKTPQDLRCTIDRGHFHPCLAVGSRHGSIIHRQGNRPGFTLVHRDAVRGRLEDHLSKLRGHKAGASTEGLHHRTFVRVDKTTLSWIIETHRDGELLPRVRIIDGDC